MKKHVSLLSLILSLVIIVVSITYAFYTGELFKSGTSPADLETKTMTLAFTDGPGINISDILPGQSVIKTFTVQNTGTTSQTYYLLFDNVTNELSRKEDMVYTLSSTGGGASVNVETQLPSYKSSFTGNVTIAPNTTHTYQLTITYKNRNFDQAVDMNKIVSATIQLSLINYDSSLEFDEELLNQGHFYHGTHSFISDNNENVIGFQLVGASESGFDGDTYHAYDPGLFIRYEIELDLTGYTTLSYKVRRIAEHGSSTIFIRPANVNMSAVTSADKYSHIYCADLALNTWYDETIDVTALNGSYVISFVGGYYDYTGDPASATEYSDIVLSR